MKKLLLILSLTVLLMSCTQYDSKISYGVIHEVYNAAKKADPRRPIVYKVKVPGDPEYRTVMRYNDIHNIGDTLKIVERVRL